MNATGVLDLRVATVAIAAGCATLLLRPALMAEHGSVALVVVLFSALLVIGVSAPVVDDGAAPPALGVGVSVAIGCAVVLAGRLVVSGDAIAAAVPRIVALNTLAAVGEEAFFRRLVYGRLAGWGPAAAVVGSAVLFAVVHVTVYGWWVLPIDLAAGLLFSWQRWVTGTWAAPAVTHAVANLLAVI